MAETDTFAEPEPTGSLSNPFPGLRPYSPAEHYLYFGRAEQTNQLMSRLRSGRFLSVVGTSGSGKSSLVLAGLVPALHSGFMTAAGSSWRVATLRPGAQPIVHLAEQLARPDVLGEPGEDVEIAQSMIEASLRSSSLGLAQSVAVAAIPERDNVLLVVDQFEELYRFKQGSLAGAGREEAMAFVKLLLQAAEQPGRLYIVITMRSDFIGDAMEFPGLPEAINEGQYLVPKMTRDELRQAITGPVGVAGGRISPRLVSRLLNEVGDEIDQLPILQHALMRMWEAWDEGGREGAIDLEQYKAIGTMESALSLHLEEAYGELGEDRERKIAELLFKALTELEGEGRGIRRPTRLGELCAIAEATEAEVAAVVGRFNPPGRSFLLPPSGAELTSDSIVDISHESLMRNWVRLAGWTAEEASAAEVYRRLSEAARHHESGRGGLWRSPELDLGLAWRDERHPTAAWARRYDDRFDRAIAFLEESRRARDEYKARLERSERRRRRGKRLAVAIAGLFLVLAGMVWNVVEEKRQLMAVTVALSEDDPLIKALVLSELPDRLATRLAHLLGRPEPAAGGLEFEALRQVAYERIPIALFRHPDRSPVTSAGISGPWAATGDANGVVRLWPSDGRGDPVELAGPPEEAKRGRERADAHRGAVTGLAFAPGGERLLTSSADGTARVWSLDGSLLRSFADHRKTVTCAAFDPSGERIVTSSTDGTARAWALDGTALGHHRVEGGEVRSAEPYPARAGSDDPRAAWVLSVSSDTGGGRAIVWHAETGAEIWSVLDSGLRGAWFVPGRGPAATVLTVFRDGAVRIFNVAADTGGEEPSGEKKMHAGSITGAAISADGAWILTFASDATASLWRPADLENPRHLSNRGARVVTAAFVLDGEGLRRLATAYANGRVSLWSMNGEELWRARGHIGEILGLAFDGGPADGGSVRLMTAGADGTARVWPMEAGEPRQLGSHAAKISGLAFRTAPAPGSPSLATASYDGTVRLWTETAATAAAEPTVLRHPGSERRQMNGVAFAPDGEWIATASSDRTAAVWDLEGNLRRVLGPHQGSVSSAVFDPEGTRLLTASTDGRARVWSRSEPPELLATLVHPKLVQRGRESEWAVTGASFGPGPGEILTASADGKARIWRSPDEAPQELEHPAAVTAAVAGVRGEMVLTASQNGAWIWRRDAEQGWFQAASLAGHLEPITGATFDRNGRKVVTSSKDGTVRVWSAETGGELYQLRVGWPVGAARFSPDGRTIVTGSEVGAVEEWRVTRGGLTTYLEESTTACLTVEQRCLFLREWQRTARRGFAACERRAGRTPPVTPGSCR